METEDSYNFEKLKTFHIPRKKEHQNSRDILNELSVKSREFTHTILPAIKSTYFYPQTSRRIKFDKVEIVRNNTLQKEFLQKKKDLKDEGRTEKELAECYGFYCCQDRCDVEMICSKGLEVGNTSLVTLGKPRMGVYLSKHADVVLPNSFVNGDQGFIVVFKLIKGKTKVVMECRGATTTQEPTPLFDCHIAKMNADQSKANHNRAFQALQYYVYEYGDIDIIKRPRQIIPHAVVHFCYADEQSVSRKDSVTSVDLSSEQSYKSRTPSSKNTDMVQLWKGKLLVRGGLFCSIRLVADVEAAVNVAFLDRHLNVKSSMSMDKFTRQLPPTLLNKTGKRHNVIYRGRNYNIFTILPVSENGVVKFRQLMASLVQSDSVATIPLRQSSCLYLLPKCHLTQNKMGLVLSKEERPLAKNDFLYAVVVTPKYLGSKVNELKVFNILHVRKKKEENLANVPVDLDQKLLQMNINSAAAVGSMQPDNMTKIHQIIKDKKRIQTSEKFLHHHFKDSERLLFTAKDHNRFSGKIGSLWSSTCQARLEFSTPKENQSIQKERRPSLSSHKEEEATFSDEDGVDMDISDSPDSDPLPALPSKDPRSRSSSLDQIKSPPTATVVEKRKISTDLISSDEIPVVPAKIFRPSFKPLEEALYGTDANELLLHPDFVLSDRFAKTHTMVKGEGFGSTLDVERPNQLSLVICQQVPFSTEKDCPYACDGDPVIKSMIRAVYGVWEGDSNVEDREKVLWVRQMLHLHKVRNASDPRMFAGSSSEDGRKIVEDGTISSLRDSSPSNGPGGSSSDSGFQSSSTTTTPNPTGQSSISPTTSSLHNIASLIASALEDQSSVPSKKRGSVDPKRQEAARDILKVIAETVNENEGTSTNKDTVNGNFPTSTPPGQSPVGMSTWNKTPNQEEVYSASDLPQDPRLTKRSAHSHRRLHLPVYRFPPSTKAAASLPNDAKAARDLRLRPSLPSDHSSSLITPSSSSSSSSSSLRRATTGGILMKTGDASRSRKPSSTPRSPLAAVAPRLIPLLKPGGRRPMQGPSVLFPQRLKTAAGLRRNIRVASAGPKPSGTPPSGPLKLGRDGAATTQALAPSRSSSTDAERTRRNPDRGSFPTTGTSSESTPRHRQQSSSIEGTFSRAASSKVTALRKKESRGPSRQLPGGVNAQNLIYIPQQSDRATRRHDPGPQSGPRQAGAIRRASGEAPSTAPGSKATSGGGDVIVATRKNYITLPPATKTLSPDVTFTSPQVSSVHSPSGAKLPALDGSKPGKGKLPLVIDISTIPRTILDNAFDALKLLLVTNKRNAVGKEGSSNSDQNLASTQSSSAAPPSVPSTGVSLSEQDIMRMREKMKKMREKKLSTMKRTKQQSGLKQAKRLDSKRASASPGSDGSANSEQMKSYKVQPEKQQTAIAASASSKQPDDVARSIPTVKITQRVSVPSATYSSGGGTANPTVATEASDKEDNKSVETSPKPEASQPAPIDQPEKPISPESVSQSTGPPNNQQGMADKPSAAATSVTDKPLTAPLTGGQVLSELDKIITQVRSDSKVDATEALSNRLLELAMQLKGFTYTQSTPPPPVATTDSAQSSAPSSTKSPEPESPDITAEVTSSSKSVEQEDKTKPESVPDEKPASSPSPAPAIAVKEQGPEPAAPEKQRERDAATPTQDDTYNPQIETRYKESLAKSYHRFSPLSEVCRGKIDDSGNFPRRLLESFLHEASACETDHLPEDESARQMINPRPAQNRSSSYNQTRADDSGWWDSPYRRKPGRKSGEMAKKQPLVAHVQPQPQPKKASIGPAFFVFDPRGNDDCAAVVRCLASLRGDSFPLVRRLTDVIMEMYPLKQKGRSFVAITDELLNRSLPVGTLWVVIRSADLELLHKLPHLSLLKCAGPRVKFIRVDTAEDVTERRYKHVMSGEGGILLMDSIDVMINNYDVVMRILQWVVQTAKCRPKDPKNVNVWKVAVYRHIVTELQTTVNDLLFSDDWKRVTARHLLDMIQSHPTCLLQVATPSGMSSVSHADVVQTAVKLQAEHADHTRHMVVITEHAEAEEWESLRSSGIAVATVRQFTNSIREAKRTKSGQKFSALMRIYQTGVA